MELNDLLTLLVLPLMALAFFYRRNVGKKTGLKITVLTEKELEKELVELFCKAYLAKGSLGKRILKSYCIALSQIKEAEPEHAILFLERIESIRSLYDNQLTVHKKLLHSVRDVPYAFLCELQKVEDDESAIKAVKGMSTKNGSSDLRV